MAVADHIVVATASGGRVLAYAATTRDLVDELRARHDTWPVATAALGRVATVGALLSPTLKSPSHQITLQVHGGGPVGRIVVVVDEGGRIRGTLDEPHVDLPLNASGKLDVGGAVGKEGLLYVIKDHGLKEPYRGSVPLVSGEIGEDFTHYFSKSEQTPSAVAVGVLVGRDLSVLAAGGILLHVLPGVPDEEVERMEEALSALPSVTSLLHAGESPLDILRRLFGDGLRTIGTRAVSFGCTCGKERLGRVLATLGSRELQSMIDEQSGAELVCHFCGERYRFDGEELRLLQQIADGALEDERRPELGR